MYAYWEQLILGKRDDVVYKYARWRLLSLCLSLLTGDHLYIHTAYQFSLRRISIICYECMEVEGKMNSQTNTTHFDYSLQINMFSEKCERNYFLSKKAENNILAHYSLNNVKVFQTDKKNSSTFNSRVQRLFVRWFEAPEVFVHELKGSI